MNVKELIELLRDYPEDMEVAYTEYDRYIGGYELLFADGITEGTVSTGVKDEPVIYIY